MSWPYDCYCPSCDRDRGTKPVPIGDEGLIYVCGACDDAMVYKDYREFIESERERWEMISECDHEWRTIPDDPYDPRTEPRKHCSKCGLPHSIADEPELMVRAAAREEVVG